MEKNLNGFEVVDLDAAIQHAGDVWAELDGASVFVTGGSGFFGQWLLAVLLRARWILRLNLRVTVLTRAPERFIHLAPELTSDPALGLVAGDVRYFNFPKGRFTHLIHAATDTTQAADANPLLLMDTIVDGMRRVLDFAQQQGVRKVLFTSSGAIYGSQPPELKAIPEDYLGACDTCDWRSNYGQSKRVAEQLCTLYYHQFGLETKIARCFAFVGPGMPMEGHFAIGNFIRNAVRGETIHVKGDGTPVRSYLYVGDLVAWLLRILVKGQPGRAYNVGSDRPITIGQLAQTVAQTVPNAPGFWISSQIQEDGFRSQYIPNVTRARRELQLDVWTDLQEAVRSTADWYRTRMATPALVPDHGEEHARQQGVSAGNKGKVFVIDIDGVVASLASNNDYRRAEPLGHNIDIINRLYHAGHRIIMFTARGSTTGIDWRKVTEEQLRLWGLKYHEIHFGKPAGDYYVDDRLISISQLDKMAKVP
ncbi:MAG TPA: NAD(P)-dependent oxidoreductase [Syntrophobacteria bacterium]|nr:NAD(P)-dependent oxidoreductase [Syntrophobacteria bacterium]